MGRRRPHADADLLAGSSESRGRPAEQAPQQRVPRQPGPPAHGVGRDVALALAIGLAAGLLGLAPWLITGARLPLQNLWGTQEMPLALLPPNQYESTTLVALMVTGGAAAGFAVRCWSPVRRLLATWCATGAVAAGQVAAATQAFMVLGGGLAPGQMSSLYLAGMLAGLRPRIRALVWLADLGLLWVVPAVFSAVSSMLGTRVLAGDLPAMAALGIQVFTSALGPAGGAGPTLLLALAIAVIGTAAREQARKNHPPT
jgi:hypothetical protein